MAYIDFEKLSSRDLRFFQKPYTGKLIVLHEEDRSSSEWPVAFTLDAEQQQLSILTSNQEQIRKVLQEGYAHLDQREAGYLFSLRGSANVHTDAESLAVAMLAHEERYQKTLQEDVKRQLIKISIRQVYRLYLNKK